MKVFQAVFWGSMLLVLCSYFTGALFAKSNIGGYGRSVFLVDWLLLTVLLVGYRGFLKTSHQWFKKEESPGEPKRVALIWSSGEQGLWCLKYLRESQDPRYEVIGFINENLNLQHKNIDGLRVLGNHQHLRVLAQLYQIRDLFVAMPEISPGLLERVQETCHQLNITLLRFLPPSSKAIVPPGSVVEPSGEPSLSPFLLA